MEFIFNINIKPICYAIYKRFTMWAEYKWFCALTLNEEYAFYLILLYISVS